MPEIKVRPGLKYRNCKKLYHVCIVSPEYEIAVVRIWSKRRMYWVYSTEFIEVLEVLLNQGTYTVVK